MAVASLVRDGDILCDIGSDHAFLPIYLIQSGKIARAIAADINEKPLEKGRRYASEQGVNNIDFILSDGLAEITLPFTVAAICGMGGLLIIDILKSGAEKAKTKLLLQPMTAAEKLRAFLWENGFQITNELYTVESGKPYVVIAAEYTGISSTFTYTDTYIGKIRPDTENYRLYLGKIKKAALKRLEGIRHTGGDPWDTAALIAEINDRTAILS